LNNSKDKRKTALLQWATFAVALGLAGENGLAQLGLSACSTETGEFPRSSPTHGSPADIGRPAVSGRGRRCQGASPGGKDPDLGHRWRRGSLFWARDSDAISGGEPTIAGRRRGGEHQLGVRGAAVSSGGGRCVDGGARRWPDVALDGRASLVTKGGGRLSALTVACGGRWLRGRLVVAKRHMRAVRGGRRLEQRSAAMREQRSAVRAEWSGVAWWLSWEEERRRLPRTDSTTG
jgi:hypothetical protein